jgi:hypothetical protein
VTGDKVEDVSSDWWGYQHGFVSGGFLGARSSRKKSLITEEVQTRNERTVFFEDDQENLYNLVQVCNLFIQTISLQTCDILLHPINVMFFIEIQIFKGTSFKSVHLP